MRRQKHLLTLLLLAASIFFLWACQDSKVAPAAKTDSLRLSYASLLHISLNDSFTICDVENPWHRGALLRRYILVAKDRPLPQHLPEGTLLRTPLERVVAFTSVHASLLCELQARSSLCGLCDVSYILNKELLSDVSCGKLPDMGAAHQPDVEKIIAARPEALLVSPFAGVGYGALERTGIPLIECADYMETSPLGRAEWIRFYGMLVGKDTLAENIFRQVETEYLHMAEKSKTTTHRPSLLVDNIQSGAWYVPCGQSTMGIMFRDANAQYLFSYLEGSGSQTLSPETVLKRGRNAQLWLIKYGAPEDITYQSLAADYPLYRHIKAWQDRRVFGCNVSEIPFFEQTPFHPELLLRDICSIVAHTAEDKGTDTSWTDSLRYFKPLK